MKTIKDEQIKKIAECLGKYPHNEVIESIEILNNLQELKKIDMYKTDYGTAEEPGI